VGDAVFVQCAKLSRICCARPRKPIRWHKNWNTAHLPVAWNYR
jgi:hypothetical protein